MADAALAVVAVVAGVAAGVSVGGAAGGGGLPMAMAMVHTCPRCAGAADAAERRLWGGSHHVARALEKASCKACCPLISLMLLASLWQLYLHGYNCG